MNFLSKLKFLLKRPKVIIVTGNGRKCAREAIFQVLNRYFKISKKILLLETDLENSICAEKLKFFIKNSSFPILVVTRVGDIPLDKNFFAGEKEKTTPIIKLIKIFPARGYLILNFDDETVREIADISNLNSLSFGFQKGANFQATDIKLNTGTNFKINYQGNIVPIWLEKLFGKEQIYAASAAVATGTVFDLNLVEISQALKNYHSLSGKMRMIEGIKHSWILDDSESATVFSMAEAIDILGKISGFQRKIAVLGDIIGMGKYTLEAHEAIGERVAKNADLLFSFGPRAKFIAKGSFEKGMVSEKIFQFDSIEEGKLKLQDEIKEGDLILVDGSKEMEMTKIIQEIKAW